MMSTAPLKTTPTARESFYLMGIQVVPKVLAEETDGQFSMVEERVEPGAGSPPHSGRNASKVFYVAEGEFEFRVGTLTRRGRTGDAVVIPAGAIHSFTNAGTTRGRLFVTFTPAGHEDFLREMSDLFQREEVQPKEVEAISARHGVELLAAP